jgi:hypothetical protein
MQFRKLKISIIILLFLSVSACSKDKTDNHISKNQDINKTEFIKQTDVTDSLMRKNIQIFNKIIEKAKNEEYHKLAIGQIIAKVGNEFLGTPYLGFTLESKPEQCIINFAGLDCVTFFENVLGFARIIKKQRYNYEDLINEITFTRYRQGNLTDYTSRLHYTADWIYDNVQKGVVKDITKDLGGNKIKFNLNFMSEHPGKYQALKNQPEYINKIKNTESEINNRQYYYIPKDDIKFIEHKLNTGDIIAFVTSMMGLDYTHVGLVYVDNNGDRRLMHASSMKKKVVIDKTIYEYIMTIKKDIGITVLRPID